MVRRPQQLGKRTAKTDLEYECDKLLLLPQPRIELGKNAQILEEPRVLVRRAVVVVRVIERVAVAHVLYVGAVAPDDAVHLCARQGGILAGAEDGGEDVDVVVG